MGLNLTKLNVYLVAIWTAHQRHHHGNRQLIQTENVAGDKLRGFQIFPISCRKFHRTRRPRTQTASDQLFPDKQTLHADF